MTTISHRFATLRQNRECALIPFITAGDPDLETTAKALQILDQSGADFIELGIPYSDPLADGPVIQAAATRSLSRGTTLEQVLEVLQFTIPSIKAPIILFTYYNPILHRGIAQFLQQIQAAGVSGLVVPDLPLEEASNLLQIASQMEIDLTLLIAPTTPTERIKAIAHASQGFIYLVSVTGVTGVRSQIAGQVLDLLKQIRSATDKPVGVGFGISQLEQASQVKEWGADAVIVGSAFVQRLAQGTPAEGLTAIAEFCQNLKTALGEP